MPFGDGVSGGGEHGVLRIPERALPESEIAGRDVEVARQAPKGLGFVVDAVGLPTDLEVPAVEDGQTVADVPEGDGQIDGVVGGLGHGPSAGDLDPVIVHESDLLGWILQPRRDEDRTDAGQERPLGDPGGPVGGADGDEGGGGQNKGARRRGQRGADGPVVHQPILRIAAPGATPGGGYTSQTWTRIPSSIVASSSGTG